MRKRNPALSTIDHYRRAGSGPQRHLCACGQPFTRQHLHQVLAQRRAALEAARRTP